MQVRSQQSKTAAQLAETTTKADLADRLQTQLQQASDALLERESDLQDLHSDVEQVLALVLCTEIHTCLDDATSGAV